MPLRADVLRAGPVDTPDGVDTAALFFVDEGQAWSYGPSGYILTRPYNKPTRILGTTLDGRQLWEYSFTNQPLKHVAADQFGGVVVVIEPGSVGPTYLPRSIRRIDGVTGSVSWEYIGKPYYDLSEVAIRHDGKIFVTEGPDFETEVLEIDALTGSIVRHALPEGHRTEYENGVVTVDSDRPPKASGPIVLEDGRVVVALKREFSEAAFQVKYYPNATGTYTDPLKVVLSGQLISSSKELLVWMLASDPPAVSLTTLDISTLSSQQAAALDPAASRLLPDGSGNLLLAHRKKGEVMRLNLAGGTASAPVSLLPPGVGESYESEYVLSEDHAYALIQGFKTFQYAPTLHWTKLVSFSAVTSAIVEETPLAGNLPSPSYLRLRQTVSGGGVIATGPEQANATSFAPALWGDMGTSPRVAVGVAATGANTEWAQSRGLGRSNAARRSYSTVDAAAIAILREMVPISNRFNREFGGSICRNTMGRYIPLEPIEGSQDSVSYPSCIAPLPTFGGYHTHPDYGGNFGLDGFSGQDLYNYWFNRVVGYVGTVKDVLGDGFDQCASQGQGNIWKAVMDLSVPTYDQLNPPIVSRQVIGCAPLK